MSETAVDLLVERAVYHATNAIRKLESENARLRAELAEQDSCILALDAQRTCLECHKDSAYWAIRKHEPSCFLGIAIKRAEKRQEAATRAAKGEKS